MRTALLIWLLFVFNLFGVILEWDAVSTNVDGSPATIAGYRVYTGRQSRVYSTVLDVGNVTLAELTTAPGTTYYAVTAYDEEGSESDFSEEVFYTAPAQFFIWRLPAGQVTIEHTFGLLFPITWLPLETVTGPKDYVITVDKNISQEYFRYLIQP